MKQVRLYTDGGCIPNPGVGGYAAVLLYGEHRRELSGGELETTNNRMELRAVIAGLGAIMQPCEVELYTDSQYVANGVSLWLPSWKERGDLARGGFANADLWQELEHELARHRVICTWVRGHAGDRENERCDELAFAEIARQYAELGRPMPVMRYGGRTSRKS